MAKSCKGDIAMFRGIKKTDEVSKPASQKEETVKKYGENP